jgi:CubicO group peptidase (beta-lactamase class C family)
MSDINQLQSLLASGIDNHLYSCAQLVISDAKHDIANLCVGKTRLNYGKNDSNCRANAITSETLFDVASLTKPIATTSLVMQALAERKFSLKQKLITLNSFPLPSWCLGCTIEELLSHQTPLPAWFDFHETLPRREDHETAKRAFAIACQKLNPRDDNQSWCYSDIGFIILGFLLESIYGMELDKLFNQKVAEPLGLESQMMYRPLHHVDRSTIAATCPYQDAYIQGHPDDANARALTHIAGHAGLFASARAIAAFVRSLISHSFPCPASIIDQFLTYRSPRTPFALGWDRPTSDDSLSARKAGENVIGHLGFTGCSVWIDLDTKRSVTLLTNRTHMNDNPKSIADLRRKIHKLSWELP